MDFTCPVSARFQFTAKMRVFTADAADGNHRTRSCGNNNDSPMYQPFFSAKTPSGQWDVLPERTQKTEKTNFPKTPRELLLAVR